MTTNSDQQTVLELNRRWSDGLAAKDRTAFDQILDDQFHVIGSGGHRISKERYIAFACAPEIKIQSDDDATRIVTHGDLALVYGKTAVSGQFKNKRYEGRQEIYTNIYHRTHVGWKAIASQATLSDV